MKTYKEWKAKDIAFFKKRKEIAEKSLSLAHSGGNPGRPDRWRLDAELVAYGQALKILESETDPEAKVRTKYSQAVSRMSSAVTQNQRRYQEALAELAVYGEVLVQLRKPELY